MLLVIICTRLVKGRSFPSKVRGTVVIATITHGVRAIMVQKIVFSISFKHTHTHPQTRPHNHARAHTDPASYHLFNADLHRRVVKPDISVHTVTSTGDRLSSSTVSVDWNLCFLFSVVFIAVNMGIATESVKHKNKIKNKANMSCINNKASLMRPRMACWRQFATTLTCFGMSL